MLESDVLRYITVTVLKDQQCKNVKSYSGRAAENLVHTCNSCLRSIQHLWETVVGMDIRLISTNYMIQCILYLPVAVVKCHDWGNLHKEEFIGAHASRRTKV